MTLLKEVLDYYTITLLGQGMFIMVDGKPVFGYFYEGKFYVQK